MVEHHSAALVRHCSSADVIDREPVVLVKQRGCHPERSPLAPDNIVTNRDGSVTVQRSPDASTGQPLWTAGNLTSLTLPIAGTPSPPRPHRRGCRDRTLGLRTCAQSGSRTCDGDSRTSNRSRTPAARGPLGYWLADRAAAAPRTGLWRLQSGICNDPGNAPTATQHLLELQAPVGQSWNTGDR
jgi:hypothetical protein